MDDQELTTWLNEQLRDNPLTFAAQMKELRSGISNGSLVADENYNTVVPSPDEACRLVRLVVHKRHPDGSLDEDQYAFMTEAEAKELLEVQRRRREVGYQVAAGPRPSSPTPARSRARRRP